MLSDALKFFVGLVQDADTARPIPVPSDPRFARIQFGGKVESIPLSPTPREHTSDDVRTLIEFANDRNRTEADASLIVWVGDERVVLILDDDGHRIERFTVELQTTHEADTVADLASALDWRDQRSFLRLLRYDLAGVLDSPALVEAVRSVRFENGTTVTAEKQRDRESLGKSIASKVQSAAGEIPDEVGLTLRVWRNPGLDERFALRCAVEVDPALGRFALQPFPGELDRVVNLALGDLAATIRDQLDNSIPLYRGEP
jgi:hypothetical protein